MNYRMSVFLLGRLMIVAGFLMCIPLVISLCLQEGEYQSYLTPVLALWIIGLASGIRKPNPEKREMYAREGFFIVSVAWLILSFFGALPFFISGDIPNFIDALFETVSGFTTTGATLIKNVEGLRKSAVFWRSFTQWIGGMGVLVFALAILPQSNAKSMHIFRAEIPGPKVGKLVSKTRFSARILYIIYVVLTLLEIAFLLCGNVPFFDSVVTSFATAGTGGFSQFNASISGFGSLYTEVVVTVFMMLFGINFNLFFFLILRKFSECFKNGELRAYLGIIIVSVTAVTVNIFHLYRNVGTALRYSSFQVVSIISSTGFSTGDYTKWPVFSQILLVLLMFIGGCAGSTSGGLKVNRVILLFKTAAKEVGHTLNPRSIVAVKTDGKNTDQAVIKGVSGYFVLYFFIIAFSTLLVSLDKTALTETVTSVISCINNTGSALGKIGPIGDYTEFSPLSKIVLSCNMLLGRLEIFPLLLLFRRK